MVLFSGFPEVPTFCSWIVTLQTFWFLAALLGAWKGHIYSSFLVFCGTPFELSQSHFSCAARPEDPESLAASGYLDPVLSLDSLHFWFWIGWAFFFPPFVSWALRPVLSWVLDFKSFGLIILFPCGELNLFNITFYGVGPLCYFWALVLWFFRPQQGPREIYKINLPRTLPMMIFFAQNCLFILSSNIQPTVIVVQLIGVQFLAHSLQNHYFELFGP